MKNDKPMTFDEIEAMIDAPYKPAEGEEPTAFTEDEIRAKFLKHVNGLITYWNGEGGSNVDPNRPPREKLEGLAFSILAMLDGSSMDLPGFSVTPCPHESDEQYHKDRGERWFPNDVDIAGGLHDLLGHYKPKGKKKGKKDAKG